MEDSRKIRHLTLIFKMAQLANTSSLQIHLKREPPSAQ